MSHTSSHMTESVEFVDVVYAIQVILWFNRRFGAKLVVLHPVLSMLGKFSVHPWIQYGGLDEEQYSIFILQGPN